MKQNKYDDQGFFDQYSQMARSVGGLEAAGEWPVLREMLPDLQSKRVLDLGCGYGWHCRYAREMGAKSVIGVDLSDNMLARAREMTDDPHIEYRRLAIEDFDFEEGQFDVILSSLALHYVESFDLTCRKVYQSLAQGGAFVFSVEHPVFTARAEQDWHYGPEGERLHWPVDGYQDEGVREARFLGHDVVKYHRTVATFMNQLIEAGFVITKVAEPKPTEEALLQYPEMKDEARRPIFLLIAAVKS
ncbi:class I SAM-dependent methyltransferase [Paenibacillus sp. 1011MAR3C5]|uniref:class I SAM-dependent methyltransferase n=1 Tax=Paenibacillus sp. 1011MAR3C5 TaxID=1675787 RepID=UPI000E6D2303|nr:class I SAM-dependent methyltransferase [Paenibacillus sp. 1011MAR3C5]RJE88452.1 class I SAM-dependent methyltransferase [Paenibacillus sp. 1011MAR3C5]